MLIQTVIDILQRQEVELGDNVGLVLLWDMFMLICIIIIPPWRTSKSDLIITLANVLQTISPKIQKVI